MEPKQFEKFNEINKDTVKAEEVMTPEEKEASKQREENALFNECEKRAEREVVKDRAEIEASLRSVVKKDSLSDQMVKSVLHEYKKLAALHLMDSVYPGKEYYGDSWRADNLLRAFGMKDAPFRFSCNKELVEEIRNTADVDRYSQLVTANLRLVNSISTKDFDELEESLKQIEILEPNLVESYRRRMPVIVAVLEKWTNGEMYVKNGVEKFPGGFTDATDDEKLGLIRRIAERECFNFSTDSEDTNNTRYCMGCGRIPEGFSITEKDWQS